MTPSPERPLDDDREPITRRLELDCPLSTCDFACVDQRAMAGHLRHRHDGSGRWGGVLLADGGDVDLRDLCLDACEATDDRRYHVAEERLVEALGQVRKRKASAGGATDE